MAAQRNVTLAIFALITAIATLIFRVSGVGLFQTQNMHCPGLLPLAAWLLFGLGIGALALAGASIVLEGLRRRHASGLGELQELQVGFATLGPAVSALVLVLLAFRPTVCM